MKTAFCVLLALVLANGCMSTPEPLTAEEIQQIDYGPFPANYQEMVKAYFAETLPDMNAIEFRFGEPFKGFLQHGPVFGGKVFLDGYFLDVWLKNKTDGTSEQHVGVALKNGKVLMQLSETDLQQVKRAM